MAILPGPKGPRIIGHKIPSEISRPSCNFSKITETHKTKIPAINSPSQRLIDTFATRQRISAPRNVLGTIAEERTQRPESMWIKGNPKDKITPPEHTQGHRKHQKGTSESREAAGSGNLPSSSSCFSVRKGPQERSVSEQPERPLAAEIRGNRNSRLMKMIYPPNWAFPKKSLDLVAPTVAMTAPTPAVTETSQKSAGKSTFLKFMAQKARTITRTLYQGLESTTAPLLRIFHQKESASECEKVELDKQSYQPTDKCPSIHIVEEMEDLFEDFGVFSNWNLSKVHSDEAFRSSTTNTNTDFSTKSSQDDVFSRPYLSMDFEDIELDAADFFSTKKNQFYPRNAGTPLSFQETATPRLELYTGKDSLDFNPKEYLNPFAPYLELLFPKEPKSERPPKVDGSEIKEAPKPQNCENDLAPDKNSGLGSFKNVINDKVSAAESHLTERNGQLREKDPMISTSELIATKLALPSNSSDDNESWYSFKKVYWKILGQVSARNDSDNDIFEECRTEEETPKDAQNSRYKFDNTKEYLSNLPTPSPAYHEIEEVSLSDESSSQNDSFKDIVDGLNSGSDDELPATNLAVCTTKTQEPSEVESLEELLDVQMLERILFTDNSGDILDDRGSGEVCRESISKTTRLWTKTKLLFLEFMSEDPVLSENSPKTVRFAENLGDSYSESDSTGSYDHYSEAEDFHVRHELDGFEQKLSECDNLLDLDDEVNRLEEANQVSQTMTGENGAFLKTVTKNYGRVFLHLIKNVISPCDAKIKDLVGEILSTKRAEAELFSIGSGIHSQLLMVSESLKENEPLDSRYWNNTLGNLSAVLLDMDTKFNLHQKQLQSLQERYPPLITEIIETVTNIRVNRDRILEKYFLFYGLNSATIPQNFYQCTFVKEYKQKSMWHYHVDLAEMKNLLAKDLQSLETGQTSVAKMISSIHQNLSRAQEATAFYHQTNPHRPMINVIGTSALSGESDFATYSIGSESLTHRFKRKRSWARRRFFGGG